MKAVVTQPDKTAAVAEKSVPEIKDEEVLIKVIAVALNPTDWKHLDYLSPPGVIMGCDLSGVVEKVGADVKHVKVGDKVGALVHGSKFEHTGAFAEYAAVIGDVVWRKPEHLSHEENATFGVGSLTAVACLFQKLGLSIKPAAQSTPFLVWSGSSSVGQFAIQYAKLAGFTVITTASPKNHELVKSLGATHAFDYRDPDVVKKIKEVTKEQLQYGIDCAGDTESQTKFVESMGAKGGKLATILAPLKDNPRTDVQIVRELLYTALGKELQFGPERIPAMPQDREFIRDFIKNEQNQLLHDKKIKPNVTKHMSGGLGGIPEGLAYLRSGKASAEKLVYQVQNE